MRRLGYGLLAILISLGSVQAKVYTNKTFLMPRSHNENLAMEYSGWHKQFRKIDDKLWGVALQVTGFYQASTNKKPLGKYFGMYNNATGPTLTNPYAGQTQDFIEVRQRAALGQNNPGASPNPLNNEEALLLDPRNIFHHTASGAGINTKTVFRPRQTSYGIRFDYHQKLDKLTNGMYLRVSVPVVHVKNDMNTCCTGSVLKQNLPNNTGVRVTLADYLAGKVENTATTTLQKRLCKAKICGAQSKTGVADIDVILGYNFLYDEHKHFGVNVSMVIPTDDTPDGEWLFEPTLGLAGHWAFGMGLDGAFELWQHGNKSLEFVCAANYKYVLNATEKRTLGLKYGNGIEPDSYLVAGKRIPFAHYRLGAQQGVKGVFPLANILTKDVGVEPGSRVEALASMAFNWGNFTFDAGYNLFAKERECVSLKGCCCSTGECCGCGWPNDTYAIPEHAYVTNLGFAAADIYTDLPNPDLLNTWIKKCDLLPQDAATPVYVTHKIYGGLNYNVGKGKYQGMVGLGGSWEFTQGMNSALDGYAIWVKGALTF